MSENVNSKENEKQIKIKFEKIMEDMKKGMGGKAEFTSTENIFLALIGYFLTKKGVISDDGSIDKDKLINSLQNKVQLVVKENLDEIKEIKNFIDTTGQQQDKDWLRKWAKSFIEEINQITQDIKIDVFSEDAIKEFYKKLGECYKKYTEPTWYNCLSKYWTHFKTIFKEKKMTKREELKQAFANIKNGAIKTTKQFVKALEIKKK